jgi:hypothetical protein
LGFGQAGVYLGIAGKKFDEEAAQSGEKQVSG